MSTSQSITSLAILKANWDVRHLDYIENFVPFLTNLIDIKHYQEIDEDVLCDDFKKEYGFSIPYHPMRTILTRLKTRGYIIKREHKYFPTGKVSENNFNHVSAEQQRKLNKLTRSLIDFGIKQYSFNFTESEAENALLGFFSENELGLVYAADEKILPQFEVEPSATFVVAKFIRSSKESEPEIFNFLVDVAVGAALAESIVYGEDLLKFKGLGNGLHIYLDTGYLLTLLGVNGEDKKDAFKQLTTLMTSGGAKLHVFDHTYDEMMHILTAALSWMSKGNYDIQKASRVLKYFINNSFTETDIEMFIGEVSVILSKYEIERVSKPEYSKDIHYQIDEPQLKSLIVESYKADPFFDEAQKDYTIQKDIESVYAICKLRKGKISYTLKDASHVFVTTNTGLARISSRVQRDERTQFLIPPCVTDVFIGTMLWLQHPIQTTSLNEKKLIADAFAAVQPNTNLVKKYITELDNLHAKGSFTDGEYSFMKTSRVALNMLSEKTRNDNNNFKSATTQEILEEINKSHTAELKKELEIQKKVLEEQSQLIVQNEKVISHTQSENVSLMNRNDKILNILANGVTFLFIFIASVIIVSSLFVLTFPFYTPNKFWLYAAFIVTAVLTLFGVNIPSLKLRIFTLTRETLVKWI